MLSLDSRLVPVRDLVERLPLKVWSPSRGVGVFQLVRSAASQAHSGPARSESASGTGSPANSSARGSQPQPY